MFAKTIKMVYKKYALTILNSIMYFRFRLMSFGLGKSVVEKKRVRASKEEDYYRISYMWLSTQKLALTSKFLPKS